MEDLDHVHTDQGKPKTDALKLAAIRLQKKLEIFEPSSNQYKLNLKQNGDRKFSLAENNSTSLKELEHFLLPFKKFTVLVSSEAPHLGLLPIIMREVNDATNLSPN